MCIPKRLNIYVCPLATRGLRVRGPGNPRRASILDPHKPRALPSESSRLSPRSSLKPFTPTTEGLEGSRRTTTRFKLKIFAAPGGRVPGLATTELNALEVGKGRVED